MSNQDLIATHFLGFQNPRKYFQKNRGLRHRKRARDVSSGVSRVRSEQVIASWPAPIVRWKAEVEKTTL